MLDIRRISTKRWWNKKKYYLLSKPFWPGEFQREVLTKSVEQEFFIKLKQLEKDNKRLREILSLQKVSDSESIAASVISRKTGSFWKQIILNKGAKDGVEIGSFVVGPGGLLGRVNNISLFTSSVKLLTSPESKVGVWAERIQSHGLLVGVGNDFPKVIFYNKGVDIKLGDILLTSPASTLLPPNIPVGIIQSVNEVRQAKKTANILLFGKPQAIDWVQIVKVEI